MYACHIQRYCLCYEYAIISVNDELIVNKPGSRKEPDVEPQECPELIPPIGKYKFAA